MEAQHNLGVMYDEGKGIITDYYEAYIWLFDCQSKRQQTGNESFGQELGKYFNPLWTQRSMRISAVPIGIN